MLTQVTVRRRRRAIRLLRHHHPAPATYFANFRRFDSGARSLHLSARPKEQLEARGRDRRWARFSSASLCQRRSDVLSRWFRLVSSSACSEHWRASGAKSHPLDRVRGSGRTGCGTGRPNCCCAETPQHTTSSNGPNHRSRNLYFAEPHRP